MLKIESTLKEICKGSAKVPKTAKTDIEKIKQIDAKLHGKSHSTFIYLDLKETVEKATKTYFSKFRLNKVGAKSRVSHPEMKKVIDLVR